MKHTETEKNTYSGFDFEAPQISSFLYARTFSTFIISIIGKDEPLRYKPDNEEAFYEWLNENNVREYNPY